MVLGLGRGRQGGEGTAVKSPFHRDDLEPAVGMSISPRQLDRRLVGLGSAVAEEALAGMRLRAERPLGKRLGESSLGFHVPRIGNVDELTDLVANSGDDPGRAMAQQVTAPTREEVEVAVPLRVPDPRTLTPDQADGEPAVVGHHIPRKPSYGVF